MPRASLCLVLATAVSLAGCASAPKTRVATDPTTGQQFEYGTASDGRNWVDRHPGASLPLTAIQFAAIGALIAAVVILGIVAETSDHRNKTDGDADPVPPPKQVAKGTSASGKK